MPKPFDPGDKKAATPASSGVSGGAKSAEFQAPPAVPQHQFFDNLELDHFPDGPFRDFFEYWLSLKEANTPSQAQAFDLLELSHLVADISVVDCGQARFTIRYSGAGVAAETGRDLTGLYMDEIEGFKDMHRRALVCKKTGKPYVVLDHPVTWTSKNYKHYSVLVVPLTDATDKIVQLVYIMTYS
jgi:hypothetical protein